MSPRRRRTELEEEPESFEMETESIYKEPEPVAPSPADVKSGNCPNCKRPALKGKNSKVHCQRCHDKP